MRSLGISSHQYPTENSQQQQQLLSRYLLHCFRRNKGATDIRSCLLWLPRSPPPTGPPWENPFGSGPGKYPEDERMASQNIFETQPIFTPYKQARIVPADTWRTVIDTWNGYHSFPLAGEDRYLTTFITEYGRYRIKLAPQVYLASGYGYYLRYDNIIASIPRKTKCVDEALLWDESLEVPW